MIDVYGQLGVDARSAADHAAGRAARILQGGEPEIGSDAVVDTEGQIWPAFTDGDGALWTRGR
ncbi:hypothetical protein J7E88_33000 [Streptomyces sp. ISL-10]|uniref:hypothetical protein n=1 Tax=Streptomyces sp. ISL-10 TaxID=2819172 RepID=UPI001BE7AB0A|nr:hypothetical protein [Streptomyces sp. ISL-10]MBT2369957.1 hypothetical protein [Streptomyces sp. ISL-10]